MAQDPTGMPTRQPRLGVPEVRTVNGAGRRQFEYPSYPFYNFYENNAMPGLWLMSLYTFIHIHIRTCRTSPEDDQNEWIRWLSLENQWTLLFPGPAEL
jgi:hypothetical protein